MTSSDHLHNTIPERARRLSDQFTVQSIKPVLRRASRTDNASAGTVGERVVGHVAHYMSAFGKHRGLQERAAVIASSFALAVSFCVAASPARAEGALAVGIARGGIAKGYATGFAINQPSVNAAKSNAVEQCKRTKSSNRDAKSACEVVVTFRNKCVASAVDPQSGTPGAGWGVGSTQDAADTQALSRCRAKAGADREEFCEITDRYCDGL